MNLKQLEVFLAVAESGSFSRGADASFITQSTVSQHISTLEKEFGLKLLDRTGKGAFLTEGGKVLQELARRLVAEAGEVRSRMARFRGMEDVTLVAGGSNIPGNYLVPAALPLLRQRCPGISVTLVQGDSNDIISRLKGEDVEIGIVGTRSADNDCCFAPIGTDEIRLVVHGKHPWACREKIGLHELRQEELVARESGSGTGKAVADALERAGIPAANLRIKARLGSNESVKQAVAAGAGISFLSVVSIRKEIERGELATVTVEGFGIQRQLFLASRAGRELSPAAGAFADAVRETAGRMLGPAIGGPEPTTP